MAIYLSAAGSGAGAGAILTLQEAKTHCRVNTNDDDDFLTDLILEASAFIQAETGLYFFSDTWIETFADFPCMLMKYPVSEISSIEYYDQANEIQTLDSAYYLAHLPTYSQARIEQTAYSTLPVAYPREDAWQVTYITSQTPPLLAKRAAKVLVETWYSTRGVEYTYGKETATTITNLLRKLDKRGVV